MRTFLIPFLVVTLLVSALITPGGTVHAQGVALPADMNKTFNPISISAGGTSRLNITIFNPNPFQLTNASWTDNMPANIRILGIISNSCGGTATATPGTSTISLSNGTVPAKTGSTSASCTVSVNVTSSVPGNWINIIPAGELSSTGSGGINITNTSEARATLNVTGTGTPSVSKSFNPTNIFAGGVSQLSINIVNNANTSLTGTTLTDNLPAGVFLANPASPALSGCTGTVNTPTATSVALSGGTIAAGATCTITVNVTGNVQGAYTNTIPANQLGNNQNLTNSAPATARLNVREIGVTKGFSSSTVTTGGTNTLTITLQNPKSTPYTGVQLTDNLPTPLVVAGTATTTCAPGTVSTTSTSVSLAGGQIPAGTPANPGTCTITVPVTAPPGSASGRVTNTIPLNQFSNNEGVDPLSAPSASVTVAGSDVSGTKTFTPSSISAGQDSRLRIDIFAPGDTALTNFSINDPLPNGVIISNSPPAPAPTFTGCGAATLTATPGTNSISLTGGTIALGTRCRIEVFVTGNIPATYTNTIAPSNITNDQGRVPASALTATLTVNAPSGLSLSLVKGFEPPEVFGGAASTMSLQLINPGNVALTGITFTDNMPSGMFLANPTNFNVGTCGASATLTGNPGDQSFVFSGGSLPPFGTCTLTLSATMSVNGNLTNTIDANAVKTDQGVTNLEATQASLTNQPGASVSKSFAPNPIPAGSYSLLTIIVQNTGNIDLSGMVVSDALPAGLEIAGGSAPAPLNNCGGTLTAVSGTQLIELVNGVLAGDSSCTMVVAITGSAAGDFLNTIPEGGLRADPNTRNTSPASATLTITGSSTTDNTVAGGRGRRSSARRTTTTTGAASLIPVTAGFAPGMITKLDASSRRAYDATGLSLEIPVIKVNTPIVGVESNKGSWDISWLIDQVGWLNGTAYPTWKGNSVLTGHVVNADGKPGVFYNLKALGVGEYIFVYNAGYRYTYKVVSNAFVKQNDKGLMQHEEKPYLTLVTCDTYDEATGRYLRYVMVRAVLVDVRASK